MLRLAFTALLGTLMLSAAASAAPEAPAVKPRLVVLTDIENEPDDTQSLVRLQHRSREEVVTAHDNFEDTCSPWTSFAGHSSQARWATPSVAPSSSSTWTPSAPGSAPAA